MPAPATRRVLLSVPLKGALASYFVNNLISTCRAVLPGVSLDFAFLEGAPVQQARNEICDNAVRAGYDDVVMLDKDLDVGVPDLVRILRHDVPVVCALYPHRSLDTFWHVRPLSADEQPDTVGLMRVQQSAVGFCKIKVSAIKKLMADHPDRAGLLTETGGGARMVHELFPMELVGPNTPAARIKAVEDAIVHHAQAIDLNLLMAAIDAALYGRSEQPNLYQAEDYGFCRLCAESGIPVYVDTKLIVQHEASIKLPIPDEQLKKMLAEAWRRA
jgi:hypothetical protein